MSCDAPIQAYRSGIVNPATGRRPLQFKLQGSLSGIRMSIPCGKCTGCRLDNTRRWAVRLMHESRMHSNSEFLTLTYRNEDLPDVGTLVPEHLQLFHKRFHNRMLEHRGVGIRYYACGEYGSLNRRPHYHSIIFGVSFPDKVLYEQSVNGPIYQSKYLDEMWGLGDCKIAAVTFETCAYVARYCLKKVDGVKREAGHYAVYDADGVIHERLPEFSHMSRRPGIGSTYFAKYGSEIKAHDSIIMNGKEVPSIRYYDMKIEKDDPARFKEIKDRRDARRSGDGRVLWGNRNAIERQGVKRKLRDVVLKQKDRKL